ncbi:hypothetical protein [Kitasatospora kifunensis]|uniref:Secreted protein n=1 Tax=Kitasatospora kifunensis TaxID=58351 RepID=A0A7W7RB86_KITKI|nr:hypothetical protein [Kitasatospora kifunensis]MBB4928749.1 hypothetical protein [Kitasatospora kifunensis]
MRTRKTIAIAATAAALCGIGIAAPAANADVRPMADCGAPWNNVGSPGNLYGFGYYAGQVEQQYQVCGGGVVNARGHFQWSADFQTRFPGTWVQVGTGSHYYGPDFPFTTDNTTDKDVSSPGFEVHNAKPDQWWAFATLTSTPNGCTSPSDWDGTARGTDWLYANGTSVEAPDNASCS